MIRKIFNYFRLWDSIRSWFRGSLCVYRQGYSNVHMWHWLRHGRCSDARVSNWWTWMDGRSSCLQYV